MAAIEGGKYEDAMRDLMKKSGDELRELYKNRQMEPPGAPDDWTPDDRTYLLK